MQSVKDNINIKYSEGNCRVLSRWLSCNACRVRMAYQSQRAHKEMQAALDTNTYAEGRKLVRTIVTAEDWTTIVRYMLLRCLGPC